jgi:hypothetical protein
VILDLEWQSKGCQEKDKEITLGFQNNHGNVFLMDMKK